MMHGACFIYSYAVQGRYLTLEKIILFSIHRARIESLTLVLLHCSIQVASLHHALSHFSEKQRDTKSIVICIIRDSGVS